MYYSMELCLERRAKLNITKWINVQLLNSWQVKNQERGDRIMSKIILVTLSIIIILLILIMGISFIANIQFNKNIEKEVEALFSTVDNKNVVINKADLKELPSPVQKWLQYSQVIGKERIVAVRTRQDVTMRLKESQPWMDAKVEQYFRTGEPGFIWAVNIKMAPLVHIVGMDKYINGRGNMLIKAMSLITVANGSGKEINQGTLLRYLAETMWFPSAALNDYIKWEEIDSNSAKATMTYKGTTATGVFTFSDKGEPQSFVAQRYGDFDGEYRMETWACVMNEYKEFNGLNVPSKGELIWRLKSGDFHWYNFEVKELEFNNPERY
jgi:hypothetical protein